MNKTNVFTHPFGKVFIALLATFLWGSAFPLIKISYQQLSIEKTDSAKQLVFAGYRFAIAALLIFAVMLFFRKAVRYQRGSLKAILKVSALQTVLQYTFFYLGITFSSGTNASIIAGTTSFFQILVAHFVYKNDQLSIRKLIGIAIGFCAILLSNYQNAELHDLMNRGGILLLIAMFFGAWGNVQAKREGATLDVFYITAYQMLIGGMLLIIFGAVRAGVLPFVFNGYSFLCLLYLALLSAASFVLWNNLMKHNQVGSVSMYLSLIPLFGVMLSSLFLREPFHYVVLISLALLTIGILIVNGENKGVKGYGQQNNFHSSS
ncbi:DMT family transporter [Paenibacillus athensensis]|uniref:EamA family transporter n=1 Tax=Paenibacillus athensensis TaxID=1967502 RepID=A0A4Y8PZ92_9BACL|nr:DMT family transporter [Paenibacillus athensensis]MCD1259364.1 DMT family transporter [Paenibacillus athensensis]